MIVIGITGSIGMGKTTVSNMLDMLKIPVFDSDKKVKEILEKNQNVRKKISKIWPDTISDNHNKEKIDKVALSNKIFKSNSAKEKLEGIIHPIVRRERTLFLKKFKGSKIVGLDVPLLYETGMDKECDYIFLVNTTKSIQKKRVLMRPNMTEKKFELINNNQWNFKKKMINSRPFIITTSYGKTVTFFIVLYYLFKIKLRGK
jgi:dephospho-CoA kinase